MTKLFLCKPNEITFQWKGFNYNELNEWIKEFGLDQEVE